jgi:PAS domain S-box-containing protein
MLKRSPETALQTAAAIVMLALIYAAATLLGLRLTSFDGAVSAIWPPAGIALAGLLLFGYRLWPGIVLGVLLATAVAGMPATTTIGYAVSVTVEALVSTFLLRRVTHFQPSLERLRDVIALVTFGSVLSTALGASIGVAGLWLNGTLPPGNALAAWIVWWLGDAIGVLVFAPLLLIWLPSQYTRRSARQLAEILAFSIVLIIASVLVFSNPFGAKAVQYALAYALFPLVIWATLQFGQRGATAALFIVSGFATWWTAHGVGPFVRATMLESLVLLQSFTGIIGVSALTIAAVIAERRYAEAALRRQNAYLTTINDAGLALINRLNLNDLLETLVGRASELLEAPHGFLYLLDAENSSLELKMRTGLLPGTPLQRVRLGDGLSGRVWQLGQPQMIENYDAWPERNSEVPFGRIYSIVGAPLKVGGEVIGVLGLIRQPPGPAFSNDELALLGSFAQFASIAFDNARLATEAERELSARTQALAALHESEERYRLIAENTSDLISLIDQQGAYVYASPSYTTILGYTPIELIGKTLADYIHHEDRLLLDKQLSDFVEYKSSQATLRVRHASGEWRWIDTVWNTTYQDGDRYHIAIGRDITDRKRLEEQFLQAQKMESIGRLAGGIAHDFNNLLTAILSYTEMARDTLSTSDPVRGDLDAAISAGQRAAGLTRQLLTFARRQIIEPQPLDLNELINGVDQLLRRIVGSEVELLILREQGLGLVKADPGQIEQVLLNLALNARDAMANHGKITIETHNVALTQPLATPQSDIAPGSYVQLVVADTGSGMSAEVQRKIFEPFFTTKQPGQGTGLGLAICYGIVKQHAGHITFSSEHGRGTRFDIFLPLAHETGAQAAPPDEQRNSPLGSETVLLAEDEPAVRALTGRLLRKQGYTVVDAANGVEAMELARQWQGPVFDLLVTDMIMPQMDGAALAEALQQLFPHIKVLFISGYTEYSPIHSHQLDSQVEFLHKPFAPAQLARKVRELLDRSVQHE